VIDWLSFIFISNKLQITFDNCKVRPIRQQRNASRTKSAPIRKAAAQIPAAIFPAARLNFLEHNRRLLLNLQKAGRQGQGPQFAF
jgi:hypothetical protein